MGKLDWEPIITGVVPGEEGLGAAAPLLKTEEDRIKLQSWFAEAAINPKVRITRNLLTKPDDANCEIIGFVYRRTVEE